MVLNDLCPEIRVDPQNYRVQINCEISPSSLTTTASSNTLSSANVPDSHLGDSSEGIQPRESFEVRSGQEHLTKEQTVVALQSPKDRLDPPRRMWDSNQVSIGKGQLEIERAMENNHEIFIEAHVERNKEKIIPIDEDRPRMFRQLETEPQMCGKDALSFASHFRLYCFLCLGDFGV